MTIRVHVHELEAIKDRAAANGLDMAEHVRRASMSHGVTAPVLPVLEADVLGVDGDKSGRLRRLLGRIRRRAS